MVGKPGCGGGLLGSNGQRLGRRQLGWQVDIRWVRHRIGELRSELISVDGGEDGVGASRAWGSIRRGLRMVPLYTPLHRCCPPPHAVTIGIHMCLPIIVGLPAHLPIAAGLPMHLAITTVILVHLTIAAVATPAAANLPRKRDQA